MARKTFVNTYPMSADLSIDYRGFNMLIESYLLNHIDGLNVLRIC